MIYNRIPAVFGNLRKITLAPISYQFDVVQRLVITGLELPEYYQVDFCNDGDTSTITMVGTADGVDIPDQFLQTGKNVKAYLVVTGVDEGAAETRYEITIPVIKRPTRTDIEPTPVEQSTIDSLIATMNDAVDDAEAAAEAAEGFADNASASADRAEQAAQSIDGKVERAEAAAQAAETAATRAGDAEDAASLFASNAAESAEAAHLSEVSAEGSASTATTKAVEASQSAASAEASAASIEGDVQEAEQAAQQAEASANAASQSATAAQGSATAASGSASTASTKAAEASASATTATGKATEAANSATAAQTAQQAAEAVLESIPEDYSELSEDVDELKNAISIIGETVSVASTDLISTDYAINNQNKWISTLTSNASAGFFSLSGAETVHITPQSGVNTVWAFLNSLNTSLRATPDYSTGFSGRIVSNANREYTYEVTDTMNYLYVAITSSSGSVQYPQSLKIDYAIKTDSTFTQSKIPADAKAVGDAIKRNDIKLAMLGDSITNGKVGGDSSAVPELTIPQAVSKYLGITAQNFGVNGMGWFSKANYEVNAYEYIQTLDLSAFTHVSLAYGTNDSAAALGTAEDTTEDTILGSAYRVCNYIHTQWPTLVIYIILPILGKSGGSFPTWGWGIERGPTGATWYFSDFYEAFDAFGAKYHIPIIHGDKALNAWNVEELIGDNVHPTVEGYKVVGSYMAGQIGALI